MAESVFQHSDYRVFLRSRMEAEWGSLTRMAEAARCQRSHLSRVVHGNGHLTPDQAFDLAEFWGLSEAETEYFLLLVEEARAGSPGLRRRLGAKLSEMRRRQEDLSSRLQQTAPALATEGQARYYATWLPSALHMLVSIPSFQEVASIARRLCVPEGAVKKSLEELEAAGLVRREGTRWKIASGAVHLPRTSPFVSQHHGNWRQRAVLNTQQGAEDGLHYTVVQSVSLEDYLRIKALLLEAIDRYAAVAGPSKEQELICFSLDLFRV